MLVLSIRIVLLLSACFQLCESLNLNVTFAINVTLNLSNVSCMLIASTWIVQWVLNVYLFMILFLDDNTTQVPFPELNGESVQYLERTSDAVVALSNFRLFIRFKDSFVNVSWNFVEFQKAANYWLTPKFSDLEIWKWSKSS